MGILKRLLAILLGVTVLPLRVLAYNILYAAIALLIGIGVSIGLPLMLAAEINNTRIMSKLSTALLTIFIIFPIVALLTTIALASVAAYLIYNTIIHMLESAWIGFKSGLVRGMDGFWYALETQTVLGDAASLRFRAFLAGVNAEELIDDVDFDGFQRVVGELHDVIVVHKDLEVPDLQSEGPSKSTALLSDIESQKIEELIKKIDSSKEPLPLKIKEKLGALKTVLTQYKDLSRKLEEVRTALVSNDKSKINDELIAFNDVETPILLVKQYKKENQWHNVPACSYVTDKESLLHWLKTNPKHPVNKDLLKNPEPYNKMETKYTWYELTVNDCSSQELGEAAAQMRVLSKELLTQLSETQGIHLGLGSSSQFFLGSLPTVIANISLVKQDDFQSVPKCS